MITEAQVHEFLRAKQQEMFNQGYDYAAISVELRGFQGANPPIMDCGCYTGSKEEGQPGNVRAETLEQAMQKHAEIQEKINTLKNETTTSDTSDQ